MRLAIIVPALALHIVSLVGPASGNDALSLRQSIDLALKQNPSLLAARSEVAAANAGERGARALANPEILVAPTIVGEAGSDSAVSVVQPFEVNGQRSIRGKIAHFEAAAVQASQRTVEREVTRSVKQAYWDIAQARNVVELNRENVSLADALYEAAKRQFDVGSAPGSQSIKTQVELTLARQDLARAELDLAQAKASLNVLMGRAPATPLELADELKFTPTTADANTLRAASENNSELAEARALLSARQADIRAAEVRRRPDLVLQARQESFGDDVGVAVGVTIPLLDWGSAKAERKKAEAEASAQASRVEAVRNAVNLDVDSAIREVERSESLIREYQQGVVSQAEQLAEMARKGFKAGANSYLEVLEAQRTLKNVKTQYYAALADNLKAQAQLEWALGADLSNSVHQYQQEVAK